MAEQWWWDRLIPKKVRSKEFQFNRDGNDPLLVKYTIYAKETHESEDVIADQTSFTFRGELNRQAMLEFFQQGGSFGDDWPKNMQWLLQSKTFQNVQEQAAQERHNAIAQVGLLHQPSSIGACEHYQQGLKIIESSGA